MLDNCVHKNLVILAFSITYGTNLSMITNKITKEHTCLDLKQSIQNVTSMKHVLHCKTTKIKILRLSLQSTPPGAYDSARLRHALT